MSRARERANRIVETAIELAEEGGFENVRLRDVAANSGVALGTLYRHFRSKEDLLVAALAREVEGVEARAGARPPEGTPLERVETHFRMATRALCRRPKLARALLRAVASGEPELTEKVTLFHDRTTRLIIAALRGTPPEAVRPEDVRPQDRSPDDPIKRDADVADVLQHVWFSGLVGWSGGIRSQTDVVEGVRRAAELMLASPGQERS
jgi:AcrR family transcriptional regulator